MSLEPEVKAEEAPAPGLARFSLFPTVEEQVEAIVEAQAEEKRQAEIDASSIHRVSDAVVDRILTSGGNSKHSIERIVAFFQKNPSNADAAAFLEKEYGVGGKGLTIAKEKYAMETGWLVLMLVRQLCMEHTETKTFLCMLQSQNLSERWYPFLCDMWRELRYLSMPGMVSATL